MVTEKEPEKDDGVEHDGVEIDLKQENEALAREVKSRDAVIARLEQTLDGKESEITDLNQSLHEAKQALDELSKALPQAVAAYKEVILQANPGVLAELITGDNIEEVNESLKNARTLMERVRQEIDEEVSKTRIPAGAPRRAPLDLSALTPREKIKYAIGGER